MNPWARVEN
jgi:hypothetical protein